MRVLFVHQNFPAQFHNLASALAEDPANEAVAIGSQSARPVPKVALYRYTFHPPDVSNTHPFARRFDLECRRAEQVLYLATQIRANGFVPDIVMVHCGWGENLPLRGLFPGSKLVTYCEFFYKHEGLDVNFDPEAGSLSLDGIVGLQARNACTLLALAESDIGLSPTRWQRSTFPVEFQRKIKVCHEGIDVDKARPDPDASVRLRKGGVLKRGDEVVTFVCRNLEPLRGYHTFMRSLPRVLEERREAQVVIIGGDHVSYGAPPPAGASWKSIFFEEVKDRLDVDRVHFLDKVPYAEYLKVLQVSAAHVYLTYPFVLSWSLIEAMAVGCAVIASDTAPVREAVDADSGILVDFFDSDALAGRIIEVLGNGEAFAPMRERARRVARARYDRNVCVQNTLKLIGAVKHGPASGDAYPR